MVTFNQNTEKSKLEMLVIIEISHVDRLGANNMRGSQLCDRNVSITQAKIA